MKSIISLLGNIKKKYLISILIFLQITTILDVVSLSLIIPIMHVIINIESINELKFFREYFVFLTKFSQTQILISILLIFAAINVMKSSIYVFLNYRIHQFAKYFNQTVSNKILIYYLTENYENILNNKNSSLIRNITEETERTTYAVINLLSLITEIIMMTLILGFIFYIDSVSISLVILTTVLGVFFFKVIINKKLTEWSSMRQKMFGRRLSKITDSIQAFIEINLLNKSVKTAEEYHKINETYFNKLINYLVVQSLPRFIVEFFALLGICLALIFMIERGFDTHQILSSLAVLAAGALRLLPGFNKVYSCIVSFSFSKPSVKLIRDELRKASNLKLKLKNFDKNFTFKESIILNKISFKYLNSIKILDKVDIQINKGDTLGIKGSSGSGKSTLVKIIMGILPPSKGQVLIDNTDLTGYDDKHSFYDKIAYVAQSVYLFNDTIKNNIAFCEDQKILSKEEEERLKKAIEVAQLEKFINNSPNKLDTMVGENGIKISGGQKQRIGIARALYLNREILILDEATNSLDLDTESKILQNIKNNFNRLTIIMISHRVNNYEICNKIFDLDKNKNI